jgi:hypothetical protein
MTKDKYRAWDVDGRKMIYGEDAFIAIFLAEANPFSVFVTQCTGMKDSKGGDVYHKDICVGNWPYAKKCIVEWDDKRCGFYLKPLSSFGKAAYDKGYKMNANKFTIIGNAFENPCKLTNENITIEEFYETIWKIQ